MHAHLAVMCSPARAPALIKPLPARAGVIKSGIIGNNNGEGWDMKMLRRVELVVEKLEISLNIHLFINMRNKQKLTR